MKTIAIRILEDSLLEAELRVKSWKVNLKHDSKCLSRTEKTYQDVIDERIKLAHAIKLLKKGI